MALYVLGKRVGIHLYDMVPQFSTVYFVFSQIWNNFFTRCNLCQDTISTYKYPYMLRICRPNFMKFKDR